MILQRRLKDKRTSLPYQLAPLHTWHNARCPILNNSRRSGMRRWINTLSGITPAFWCNLQSDERYMLWRNHMVIQPIHGNCVVFLFNLSSLETTPSSQLLIQVRTRSTKSPWCSHARLWTLERHLRSTRVMQRRWSRSSHGFSPPFRLCLILHIPQERKSCPDLSREPTSYG